MTWRHALMALCVPVAIIVSMGQVTISRGWAMVSGNRLYFGGTSASEVMLSRTSTTLSVRLADNSANADLIVGTAFPTRIELSATAFASLGTPNNGSVRYCSDCTIANPCAGSGTGAIAKRLAGAWVCN